VPLAALGVLFLAVPVLGLVVRTRWRTIGEVLTRPESLQALRLSLECASLATVVCLLLGVPLAWLLARGDLPGRGLLRALVVVPLVLPPVVGGVALFTAFGRRGLVGRWLDQAFGITLPFTTPAVVVAEAFVAMPFLVLALFTYTSGLRAPALIAFVKDTLIYLVIIVAVIYIPIKIGGNSVIFSAAWLT
jgi:molybdate transport system permease protein